MCQHMPQRSSTQTSTYVGTQVKSVGCCICCNTYTQTPRQPLAKTLQARPKSPDLWPQASDFAALHMYVRVNLQPAFFQLAQHAPASDPLPGEQRPQLYIRPNRPAATLKACNSTTNCAYTQQHKDKLQVGCKGAGTCTRVMLTLSSCVASLDRHTDPQQIHNLLRGASLHSKACICADD